jgi:hypothetical protein
MMVTTAVIGSLVGQEAMSEVSKSIFKTIAGIFYHTNPIVKELLDDIDIYEEIDLVKTFIQEINKHTVNNTELNINYESIMLKNSYHILNKETIELDIEDTILETKINKTAEYLSENKLDLFPNTLGAPQPFISQTLTKCLYQLKDILEKIFKEINELNKGVEYHNTLWFQRIRTPKYLKNLNKIKKYQITMHNKFEYLIKLMNIYLRLDYKLFSQSFNNETQTITHCHE